MADRNEPARQLTKGMGGLVGKAAEEMKKRVSRDAYDPVMDAVDRQSLTTEQYRAMKDVKPEEKPADKKAGTGPAEKRTTQAERDAKIAADKQASDEKNAARKAGMSVEEYRKEMARQTGGSARRSLGK